MDRSKQPSSNATSLRQRAEERRQERSAKHAREYAEDPQRLLHELEVHQIELEMQNEELLRTRHEVEAGLVRCTQIFDFAPIGYFVLARDGAIRKLNFAGARLLGAERQRLVGRKLVGFAAEPHVGAFTEFLARVFAGSPDDTETRELGLVRSGISLLEARLTGALLEDDPPEALIAVEDISARRLAETVLRDEARRKDDFLAALCHELRNPLAALGYSLHVLERAEAGAPAAHQAREVLRRQLGHLAGLVDDLLDVTRIARGKIELRVQRLELGQLVRRVVDDHRPSFDASGIALTVRPAEGELWVEADPNRLLQVLGNLLGNALKFTNRGGRVEVGLKGAGRTMVALSVRDDGIGIPPDVLPQLFKPFTQAPQTLERTRGGLGLGLAVVKGLVELHHGRVDVVSDATGSAFTVRLPLQAPVAPVARDVAQHLQYPRRVLVIEDNVDIADSLRDLLDLKGHDVQVAYEGRAGLARAREFRPDVVICDLGLPDMTGYEVARAIREDPLLERTWLIALSGYGQSEDLQRSLDAGFDRHVTKPPKLDTLESVIAEAPRTTSYP
jgi:PAS domain S-box-containing protein